MFSFFSYAQTAITPLGGDIQGSAGTVSYTVGQIACDAVADATGSMFVGVQQPYEIFNSGVDNYPGITLSMSVYPNPTSNHVTLSIASVSIDDLNTPHCFLYDINGKQIQSIAITDLQTQVNLASLAASTYFLKVINKQGVLKTFKIVKH